MNPMVEAAVLETARGGILRAGLGFDRCDVAVVTNIGEGDHLGLADIDTPEKLAVVKRVIVEALLPEGYAVLNAADPLVAAMAPYSKGGVIFFALDGNHPVIVAASGRRQRAVFVRDRYIVLAEGEQETVAHAAGRRAADARRPHRLPGRERPGRGRRGLGLGMSHEAISRGLETFAPDMETVPGRFNLLEIDGATVILDYGHNVSSLAALIEA